MMRLFLVVILAILAASCSKPVSEEMAALERARETGVLDADEFADKKAALEPLLPLYAELEAARKAGSIDEADYTARKARLRERFVTLEALEKGLRTNVLNKNEYGAEKSRLLVPEPLPQLAKAETPAKPEKQASTPAGAYRMKLARVIDQTGFERPIASASILIPADWTSQGATRWATNDKCNTVQTNFRAEGPDGRAFEVFPEYNWKWADNPQYLQIEANQSRQMGMRPCEVVAPMNAEQYLRKNLVRARPNAQVVSIERLPNALAGLQQQARQAEQQAAQYGLREKITPDLARAKLRYDVNGRAMEEWVVVKTVTLALAGVMGTSYNCVASAIAERAPAGQLESSEKLFDLIISTVRVNPEWQQRMTGHAQKMQQIELQGVQERSAIISKNANEIAEIQRQGYQSQQQSQDRIYSQYSETIRGVETYRNPESGETIELSNLYGNAWVNNRGEYLLSDQPSFDPNVAFREEWKALEHVRR